jgi:hypothetical protein
MDCDVIFVLPEKGPHLDPELLEIAGGNRKTGEVNGRLPYF